MASQQQRRIDRVTAAEYLDGVEHRSTAEIRALRDECRAEEQQLSYVRRVLQGHLDIAQAEVDRRAKRLPEGLLGSLTEVLADRPSPPRDARAVGFHRPTGPTGRRAEDRLIEGGETSRLPDLSDNELADLVQKLAARERVVSDQRSILLSHLDRLQDLLVERYRDGRAAIDEVVRVVGAGLGEPPAVGGDLGEAAAEPPAVGGDLEEDRS